jgi:hypothetical protein
MECMSTDLPSQIHTELDELDVEKQRQVLAYVRALKQTSKGMTGSEFKKFAGTFSNEDAKSMIDAIEAGCEQVDPNGW